jgi:hypothetical protein
MMLEKSVKLIRNQRYNKGNLDFDFIKTVYAEPLNFVPVL